MKTNSTLRPHERDSDLYLTLGLYQLRVLETALPSARSLAYQLPALLSEVGELHGVLAKEVRDDSNRPNYPARKAELGDITYLTALALNDLGFQHITPRVARRVEERTEPDWLGNVPEAYVVSAALSREIEDVERFGYRLAFNDNPSKLRLATTLQYLWSLLPHLAERLLLGMPQYDSRRAAVLSLKNVEDYSRERVALRDDVFQDVLRANVLKLADRARRGKIKGSGDNR